MMRGLQCKNIQLSLFVIPMYTYRCLVQLFTCAYMTVQRLRFLAESVKSSIKISIYKTRFMSF